MQSTKDDEEEMIRSQAQIEEETTLTMTDSSKIGSLDKTCAEAQSPVASTKHKAETTETSGESRASIRICRNFVQAINQKNYPRALKYYDAAKEANLLQALPRPKMETFFHMALNKRQIVTAYQILQIYAENWDDAVHGPDRRSLFHLYSRLCNVLGFANTKEHRPADVRKVIDALLNAIQELPDQGKRHCYPFLLSSLLQQPVVRAPSKARFVYQQLHDLEWKFGPLYLEHLLNQTQYNRQDELPYAQILFETTVTNKHRPAPEKVIRVVENLFPHTNMDDSFLVLQALVELQSVAADEGVPYPKAYLLDMATLESMAAAASKAGDVHVIQLLWEYMEESNMEPTVSVYESTAVAFSSDPERYENAFAVLKEMETRGWSPCRALIRSMSVLFRGSLDQIDSALELVLADAEAWLVATATANDEEKPRFPLAALNVILSASAERGDLDNSVKIMNMVEEAKLPTNVDTFCFAFEALGKHLGFHLKKNNQRGVRNRKEVCGYVLSRAMEYLDMMDARGIPLDHHIVKEYVELLCGADEVQTATQVVLDSLQSGTVNNKTLYRVSISNAEKGDFDMARELAGKGTEPMPFLLGRIDRMEQSQR